MKKLNIMLGCLLIASGTLSACSYYDGSVEREIDGTQQQNSSDKSCTSDDTCTRAEHCVMCTDAFVSRNLCKLSSAKQCVAVKYGGEACTNNNDCATNECVPDEGNNTICSCSPVDETAPCADDNQFCKLAASGNYLCADKAKLGENCTETEDALPCAPGLRCNGGKCATIINENENCGAENTVCDEGLECKESVCTRSNGGSEQGGIGENCSVDGDCNDEKLVCDNKTKKCVSKCQDDIECSGSEMFCHTSGRCMDKAALNEACGEDYPCKLGLFCRTDGQCANNGTEGYPCTDSNNKCSEGYICISVDDTEKACAKIREEGEECSSNEMCKSKVCDFASMTCSKECSSNSACGKAGDKICFENVCRTIEKCPSGSKKCLLAFRLRPNLQWNYGKVEDSWIVPSDGDYYSSIFSLYLPDQATYAKSLDFCARSLQVFQQFIGDDNETHIDDPIQDPIGTAKKLAEAPDEEKIKIRYECTEDAKKLKGEEFAKTYVRVIETLKIIVGLEKVEKYKYAAALVDIIFKNATTSTGEHVFSKGMESLAELLEKNELTCREFEAFYNAFGYDFTTIFANRYVLGRLMLPCIEVALGKKLPFKLEYRNPDEKKFNKRDFYFQVKLFASPLMDSTDSYVVGIAPFYDDKEVKGITYENNYPTAINFTDDNAYQGHCNGKESIAGKGCVQTLTSKFENGNQGDKGLGYNILVTYNKDQNNFTCYDKNVRLGTCKGGTDLNLSTHSAYNACGLDSKINNFNYNACLDDFDCLVKEYNKDNPSSKINTTKINSCKTSGEGDCKLPGEYGKCIKDTCTDSSTTCCDDVNNNNREDCCKAAYPEEFNKHAECCEKEAREKIAKVTCIPTLAINALSFQAYIELTDDDLK